MIKNLLSKFSLKVFIEFGSYEIKIWIPKFEKFETFLSVIALDKSNVRYQIFEQYYNPVVKKDLKLFYPFKGGTIVDYHSAEILTRISIEKILKDIPVNSKLLGLDYYVSLHSNISEVQISAISDILNANSANKVTYFHESVPVAKAARDKINNKKISDRQVLVHIGHSVSEILAIEGTNIIHSSLQKIGAQTIVDGLCEFINTKYKAAVSDEIIHDAFFENPTKEKIVKLTGKNTQNGKPTTITLQRNEFLEVAENCLKPVSRSLDSVTSTLPNSFTKVLDEVGVFFAGGVSNIPEIKTYLEKEIGIKVHTLKVSEDIVTKGLELISEDKAYMQELEIKDFVML